MSRLVPQNHHHDPFRLVGTTTTTTRANFSTTTITLPQEQSRPERPRRALMSVPGCDFRKIQKAQGFNADAVVLDLEDGVPLEQKNIARQLVQETLVDDTMSFGSSELIVRINGLTTDLAIADLQAVLPCPRLNAIVIPKVETQEQIEFVQDQIRELCGLQRDVRILAAIESALGLLNLRSIAETNSLFGSCSSSSSSSHPMRHYRCLDALIFASEDYCADLEMIRTPHATELLYARSMVVTTAKAFGLQAIDMVHIDFKNLQALQKECEEGVQLGFTGKQAIHPNQIDMIQQTFVPSPQKVDFAKRIVESYQETTKNEGKGACVVDGIVVDAPVYKWAMKILQRAKQAGIL